MEGRKINPAPLKEKTSLVLILAGAFLLQAVLQGATEGYSYDMGCFYAWAGRLASLGPGEFYSPDYFADYPPGGILALYPAGIIRNLLGLEMDSVAWKLVLGFLPALAVCGIAYLTWSQARRVMDSSLALRLTALVAFNPALLYAMGIWKQVDSLFLLALAASFVQLERKRYLPAAFLYGLALSLKPQALLAGPILALAFLEPLRKDLAKGLKNLLAGAAASVGTVLAIGLPFYGTQVLSETWNRYFGTFSSYPYASVNGFNFMAALGGNWVLQEEKLFFLTWQQWGTAAIAVVTLFVVWLAWKGVRNDRFSPLLLGAVYLVGVFTFGHRMHERYLLAGVVFTFLAAARSKDRRLALQGAGLSLVCTLNLAVVYTHVGTENEWLTDELSQIMMRICGLATVLLWAALAWTAVSLTLEGKRYPLKKAAAPLGEKMPSWTRGEVIALAVLTFAVGVLSFFRLGDLQAPQTVEDRLGQEPLTLNLTLEQPAEAIWIYPQIQDSQGGTLRLTDFTGQVLLEQKLEQGGCFTWQSYPIASTDQSLTLTLENARVIEVSFRNGEGEQIPVEADQENFLLDEQELVPQTISYLNSFYFDEIYHARTGYEELMGMSIYETTHPPLGKDFIMLGIALLGMCGFGWRFFGTLFGVLMVPLFYLVARRLTRNREVSFFGALILAFDFMRYTQSRMATIDTYPAFFILLGAGCMIWYRDRVLEKGVHHAILPMVLGGIAFGLGCASKWTGIYAGAGLAVVYFWTLWERSRQQPATLRREVTLAIFGGTVCFVVIPLGIYLASYLPYTWGENGFTLTDWWNTQVGMFQYHSQLTATHPYESPWYTWMFDLRPVWYYLNGNLEPGVRGSIAGFYNPVLAWGGLAALLALAARAIKEGMEPKTRLVVIFFLSQLLPWVLVTRCTFLYHYWASALFALLALVVWMSRLAALRPRLARGWMKGLAGAAAMLFILYFPVLSGLPVGEGWVSWLRILPSWFF